MADSDRKNEANQDSFIWEGAPPDKVDHELLKYRYGDNEQKPPDPNNDVLFEKDALHQRNQATAELRVEVTEILHAKRDAVEAQREKGVKPSAETLKELDGIQKELERIDQLLENQRTEILSVDEPAKQSSIEPIDFSKLRTPEVNREIEKQHIEAKKSSDFDFQK